jgi:hypothetical protein
MTWRREAPGGGWEPVSMEPFGSLEERNFGVRVTIRSQAVN